MLCLHMQKLLWPEWCHYRLFAIFSCITYMTLLYKPQIANSQYVTKWHMGLSPIKWNHVKIRKFLSVRKVVLCLWKINGKSISTVLPYGRTKPYGFSHDFTLSLYNIKIEFEAKSLEVILAWAPKFVFNQNPILLTADVKYWLLKWKFSSLVA